MEIYIMKKNYIIEICNHSFFQKKSLKQKTVASLLKKKNYKRIINYYNRKL